MPLAGAALIASLMRGASLPTRGPRSSVMARTCRSRAFVSSLHKGAASNWQFAIAASLALLVDGVGTPADLGRRADLHATLAAVGLTLRVQWEPNCLGRRAPIALV